jgi:hypothetical protein
MRLLTGLLTVLLGLASTAVIIAVFTLTPVSATQPVLPITKGGTGVKTIPDCPNALTYDASTKTFGCNTTLSTMAPTTTTAAPTTTTVTTTTNTTTTT